MASLPALAAARFFVSTEFNGWFGTSPIAYTDWAEDGEDTQIANELAEIIDNEIRPLLSLQTAVEDLVGVGAQFEYACDVAEHGPLENDVCIWCDLRKALARTGEVS